MQIPYYLDRDKNWQVDIGLMNRVLEEAKGACTPRVLAVLNPGNPTGQYLPEENMKEIIHFCKEHCLLLLADEVGGVWWEWGGFLWRWWVCSVHWWAGRGGGMLYCCGCAHCRYTKRTFMRKVVTSTPSRRSSAPWGRSMQECSSSPSIQHQKASWESELTHPSATAPFC